MKCAYRPSVDCRMPHRQDDTRQNCQLCLMGQLADETSLNTRAIMNMSINSNEKEAEKCFLCDK